MSTRRGKPDPSPVGLALLGVGAAVIALTLGLHFWPEADRSRAVDLAIRSSGERAPARSAAIRASSAIESLAIDGLVVDQHGVPVSGAAVELTSRASIRSDQSGRFHIGGLRPGRYDLSAYAAGAAAGPLSLEIVGSSISVLVRLRPGEAVAVDVAPRAESDPGAV